MRECRVADIASADRVIRTQLRRDKNTIDIRAGRQGQERISSADKCLAIYIEATSI